MCERSKVKRRIQALILGVFALSFSSCQSPQVEHSAQENLRHKNWWNFYASAKDRLDRGDYKQALIEFQRCVGDQPGARLTNDQPAWRVRTYGMHFAENYFPYRELGVTYFLMGQYEEASTALKQSLEQLPSGRASHYLN